MTMLTDDALRQLIRDRRLERERDAETERLALQARALRARPLERPLRVALLGHFLAARRHALP
jgi:hypothetical protein